MQKTGDFYGRHRVIEPQGAFPQPALRLDNNFTEIYDNEILCDVETLNIDAASFTDIKERAGSEPEKIAGLMMDIVAEYGKHQNPRTGSGGMFIGRVAKIGSRLQNRIALKAGDRIASLVSLSLTPIRIDKILSVRADSDQVKIKGRAVLFESGVWVKLPGDIPEPLALAGLDVAGAPAQVDRLVRPGDTVAVIGARGKAGLLCCYQAKKKAGSSGRVIAVIHRREGRGDVDNAPFVDDVIVGSAERAAELLEAVEQITNGDLCDLVISSVSRENCEMGAILITKERGCVYFFSMATSFTKAALGAEGVARDVDMLIGNGYCRGHAELTLDILRHSSYIRNIYTERYGH